MSVQADQFNYTARCGRDKRTNGNTSVTDRCLGRNPAPGIDNATSHMLLTANPNQQIVTKEDSNSNVLSSAAVSQAGSDIRVKSIHITISHIRTLLTIYT